MKKLLTELLLLMVVLMSAPVWAEPNPNMSATAPTLYDDDTPIPSSDILAYTVWCNDLDNGMYFYSFGVVGLTEPGGATFDISRCVKGRAGTYFFVATVWSPLKMTRSIYSNQVTRTYEIGDFGPTPRSPTLMTIVMVDGKLFEVI